MIRAHNGLYRADEEMILLMGSEIVTFGIPHRCNFTKLIIFNEFYECKKENIDLDFGLDLEGSKELWRLQNCFEKEGPRETGPRTLILPYFVGVTSCGSSCSHQNDWWCMHQG